MVVLSSCANNNTQIAENTFIHGDKIYKLIDKELREIGDLNAKEIRKFEISKPKQRDLGLASLSFVEKRQVYAVVCPVDGYEGAV